MDENTERRNHYLDLAGIENYTSRFDSKIFLIFMIAQKNTSELCIITLFTVKPAVFEMIRD